MFINFTSDHSWKELANYGSASTSSMVEFNGNLYIAAEKGVLKIDANDNVSVIGQPTPKFALTSIVVYNNQLYVSSFNGFVYKYKLAI